MSVNNLFRRKYILLLVKKPDHNFIYIGERGSRPDSSANSTLHGLRSGGEWNITYHKIDNMFIRQNYTLQLIHSAHHIYIFLYTLRSPFTA